MLSKLIGLLLMVGTVQVFAAAAPDFTLPGVSIAPGKQNEFTLNQYKDKVVVLEWFNKDCPYVHKLYDSKTKTMQNLQGKYVKPGGDVVWFTVISSAPGKEGFLKPAEAQKVIKDYGLQSSALLFDIGGKVGQAYGAKTTPHMFVIDKGTLAYQGAIDDKPSADTKSLDGAHNYVDAALMSIQAKKPVKEAATTPYGCSVKY
jgi:peroxiredoxin